jgi:EAL domain-containing protein (putative c-di-GMP-specific phosphodiesterase class I)
VQGYHFSRPLPPDAFAEWYNSRVARGAAVR